MEYLGDEWVDLYDYVEIYGPVREDVARKIFRSVVEMVVRLHRAGFCHNDIKGNSFFLFFESQI